MRFCLTLLLAGCTLPVSARGLVSAAEGGLVITASNGKSRPLAVNAEVAALTHTEGLLVEVEGLLRRGVIEVDTFRIVEGPHGMAAYVGRLIETPTGLWLEQPGGQPSVRLDDRQVPAPNAVGRVVLVEGLVDADDTVHVVAWLLLGEPERAP